MADPKVQLILNAKDQASREIKEVGKNTESLSKKWKALGAAMAAASIGMAVAMGSWVKAAAQEEAGISRLSVAMKNMGLSYENSQGQLESWIDMMQQKTTFADSDQRDSLSQLIRMTGDLEEAQSYLSLAMDIAVGTGRDLAGANQMVMYAMGGNWGMVERYIPALKTCQTEEEKWMKLREMFAGQAEEFGKTTAGQFQTLQNNIGDLKEAMGEALLPVVQELLKPIKAFVSWMKEHPELTKFAAGLTAVGAGMLGIAAAVTLTSKVTTTQLIPAMMKLVAVIWTRVIPALAAKVTALLAVLAAMGPAGWIAAAAVLAGIVGLGVAVHEALKPPALPALQFPAEEAPSMQYGGRVPGRIGMPVPIIAHGGERFLGPGGGGQAQVINLAFNYQPGIGLGDESEMREAADRLREFMREGERRTLSSIE